jgi:hypothetical protein
MQFIKGVLIALIVTSLSGCAFWGSGHRVQQNGSVVDYLYPNAKQPTAMVPGVTQLRPPVRVGIAFVPGGGWGNGPSEQQKMKLLEQVKLRSPSTLHRQHRNHPVGLYAGARRLR